VLGSFEATALLTVDETIDALRESEQVEFEAPAE
jgi:hypothetical protein